MLTTKEKLEQKLSNIAIMKNRRELARKKLLVTQKDEAKLGQSEVDSLGHKSRKAAIERIIHDISQEIDTMYNELVSIQEQIVFEEIYGAE